MGMNDVKYDSEQLQKEAQAFIDSFKVKLKSLVDETLGELYVNIMPYMETDTWMNYRESLRIELEHEYKYSKFKSEWATNLRRAIFVENREELTALLNHDFLKRIKLDRVFKLLPNWEPLFGHLTKDGPRSQTYWVMLRRL